MEVSPGASSIYQKYVGRTSLKIGVMNPEGGSSERIVENKFARADIETIFKIAAGPDGKLSEQEAKTVESFIENYSAEHGIDLKNISTTEANELKKAWFIEVSKKSITSYDDITGSLNRILEELAAMEAKPKSAETDIIAFADVSKVFIARITSGKSVWSRNPNTKKIIREKIYMTMDGIMNSKKLMPNEKMAFASIFLGFLEETAGSQEEVNQIHRDFARKYFPDNPAFPQEHK